MKNHLNPLSLSSQAKLKLGFLGRSHVSIRKVPKWDGYLPKHE
jgi:hypothetical protein